MIDRASQHHFRRRAAVLGPGMMLSMRRLILAFNEHRHRY